MPSIDMCLVTHIVHGGSISVIRDHGVTAESIYDESRKVFEYVMAHFGKHGKVPNPTTIENDTKIKIPPLSDVPEPVTYYIERVKERALDRLVMESTKAQTSAMDKLNTKGALNSVKRLLADINRLNLAGEPVDDWTQRTDERWAAFKAAARFMGGVTGLPTPWPGINELTKGMQLGDFWLIVGRPKAGKSWELCDMAIHSWLTPIPLEFDSAGNVTASRPAKVLTITTEMLKEDVKERMDAIYSKLSYTGIVSGTLGMHIEDEYRAALDGLKGKNPLWIVTRKRVKDIQDVPIIVEEMQPDIVYLDGLYKLKVEGARFKSTWEKVTEIADELDLIAKTKGTIIVGTTQFNRGAVKTGGQKKGKKIPMAGLENLAFADALGMNPDVVLGVISSKTMKENNEAILQLIANRRGKEGAWLCNFNPDHGEFGEISAVDEGIDSDSDGDEGGDDGDTSVAF